MSQNILSQNPVPLPDRSPAAAAAAPRRHTIGGRVTRSDGTAAPGVAIGVAARRLRTETLLGETVTDATGVYRFEYAPPDGPADIVVRAVTADGSPAVTVGSAARADQTADLVLPGDAPAEYPRLLALITPLLDGITPDQLRTDEAHQDIAFLARATGEDGAKLAGLAAAARFGGTTSLPAQYFYGLLRKGMPPTLSVLSTRPVAELRERLTEAAGAHLIEPVSAEQAADFAEQVRHYAVATAFDPAVAPLTPLAEVFTAAVPDAAMREQLYSGYLDRGTDDAALWERLGEDPQAAPHVARLRLAIELSTLTGGTNPALTVALLARFVSGELTAPRDLVRLDDQWPQLIAQAGGVPAAHTSSDAGSSGAGSASAGSASAGSASAEASKADASATGSSGTQSPEAALSRYAEGIRTRVAQSYLSAHVARRLSADPAHADRPGTRFLAAHPDLDLLATPVDSRSVPDPDARAELAEIQRVLTIAPRYEAMQVLRDAGFGSAQSVARIGPDMLASRIGASIDRAESDAVHARATRVHARAVNLVTDVRTAGHFDVPWLAKPEADIAQIPDWQDLFGSEDYAAVPDCRTLYSEAAYLVDLLYYLRLLGGGATDPGRGSTEGPVADVLYARRPDLLDLLLNCDNTDLTLPYIDLVNEHLETAVSPSTAFAPTQLQSSGDSVQLSIQPQFVNQGAYDTLRTAIYPWDLPFDLWGEQTRSYLGTLGVTRVQLLSTLGTHPGSLVALTNEQLGLSTVAAEIITGQVLSPARTLAEFYGSPAGTDPAALVTALSQVSALLAAAGMRYADLTAVLDTRFVNPGGTMRIPNDGVTVDTTKLTVQNLDAAALDRLHRFERLRRALGWSAQALDRVLAASNNAGLLDVVTLRCIAALTDLAARLGLAVDDVLCFYAPLETHVYATDPEAPRYDRLFLDPSVVMLPPGVTNPFALRADRTELAVIGSLADPLVTAALLAVLQVTDAELAGLVGGARAVVPDGLLNLANLTALVRATTLARALGLSIPDYLRLVELAGASGPFPALAAAAAGPGTGGAEPDLSGGAPVEPPAHPRFPQHAGGGASDLAGGTPILPSGRPEPAAAQAAQAASDQLAAATDRFIAAAQRITAAGFAVADLDAILADDVPAHGSPLPDDSGLATVLTTLRSALQAVYKQTAQVTDDKGDVTGKDLALLGWDSGLVQQAVASLLGTATYTAALTALPAGVSLPPAIPIRFESVDPNTGQLVLVGPMTNDQRTQLDAVSADPAYQSAVQALYNAPRSFVTTQMKTLRTPVYSAPLAAWPADIQLPASLSGRVFFDASLRALCARGYLTADELALLATASADPAFGPAVSALAAAQEAPPAPGNALLTAADASAMFDAPAAPADRFHRVLLVVAPYLRTSLSQATVKQQLGQAAGLDAASAEALLGRWLRSPFRPTALEDFLAPDYVGSDASVVLTRGGFPQQFTTLGLVYRVALLLNRLRVKAADLPFVVGYAPDRWLDPTALPTAPVTGASPLFDGFVALLGLMRLAATIPGGMATPAAVFAAATAPGATEQDALTVLGSRTGWNGGDLSVLSTLVPLDGAPGLADADTLRVLAEAVGILGRLGVSADRASAWLSPDLTADAGQAAWLAAKARYSPTDWPGVAVPMQNTLRGRQRDSLVSYLVAHPLTDSTGAPQWTGVDQMHDYFLLDVETGPAQQTTRIAQGIYSVQLFVQRCLLNLETAVPTTVDPLLVAQWDWMKQYQVWVANQKVFLYPENYFQPDLRLDKTPLFTDFENEIRQQEMTADAAEGGMRGYLQKLGDVSRLHMGGFYHDGWTSLAIDGEHNDKTVYFFGRSQNAPRSYYFRTWNWRSAWTPWQKVDLDIESDVLVPTVFNGTLYVFWPTFTQKAQPTQIQMPEPGGDVPDSAKYYDIAINWSKYVNGQWAPKRTGADSLTTQNMTMDTEIFSGPASFTDKMVFSTWPGVDPFTLVLTCSYNSWFSRPGNTMGYYTGTATLNTAREELTVDGLNYDTADAVGYQEYPLDPPFPSPIGTKVVDNEIFGQGIGYGYLPDPAGPIILGGGTRNANSQLVLSNMAANQPASELPNIRFWLAYPNNYDFGPWSMYVLVFSDQKRSYIIQPYTYWDATAQEHISSYYFSTFYHPHTETLSARLDQGGPAAMYARDVQVNPDTYALEQFDFTQYQPTSEVKGTLPGPGQPIEFDLQTPYGLYNWELFFHLPLLAAQRLSTNQDFVQAQNWFHLIFDPTDRSSDPAPQRYWRTKPFFQTTASDYLNEQLWAIVSGLSSVDITLSAIDQWLANPFQPDVVAQTRTVAYQKAIVMRYLDNLIAWGDQLFRQDTLESVNAATQLYILADELLGARPEEVALPEPDPMSYRELEYVHVVPTVRPAATPVTPPATRAVVAAENLLGATDRAAAARPRITPDLVPGLGINWLYYFTLPRNEKLLGYWDTVADRLYKVRNGLTLDGAPNQPSAFGPPIDPNLLVRATAAGVDLSAVLDDISAPLPHYRFSEMAAKARELVGEVRAFGTALLTALEKRDAEALARLRSGNGLSLLTAARDVRVQQVNEAQYAVAALQESLQLAQQKQTYYSTRPFMNDGETSHAAFVALALENQQLAWEIDLAASVLGYLPDIKIGSPTTMGATLGSTNIIAALRGMSGALNTEAAVFNTSGSMAATVGGYQRRADDWSFQAQQAGGEIVQYEAQIAAAQIRQQMATQELANHDLQLANAKSEDDFLYTKYTTQELYDWMAGQLSTTYFQAYQLAYDVAKRAEQAYRRELGLDDSAFIQFGYWDSLRSGLLAGELLSTDLARMEASYLELNAREFELTKRVSLAQLDPNALLRLKETGTCFVTLPEALFDLDAPGHYLRRLKGVAVTVPCVAGPYTGVNLTLTLLRSTVRADATLTEGKYARQPGDTRFRDYTGATESIVTSGGLEDAGLFETNLRDERYLPFEGSGAVGEWRLALPEQFRQFDYESITDVVLHLRYTARDGGGALAGAAVAGLGSALNTWVHGDGAKALYRAFSARREFADQWYRFVNPPAGTDPTLTFTVSKSRFPFPFQGYGVTATKPQAVLVFSTDLTPDGGRRYLDAYAAGQPLPAALAGPGGTTASGALAPDAALGGQARCGYDDISTQIQDAGQNWTVTVPRAQIATLDPALVAADGTLNPDAVVDLVLVWSYTLGTTAQGGQ
ncbi:hypothetical protein ABH920_003745 [Catenulispora sp. EB89]|uniref:Tc toxin subunit A-related protein n=1 Tax=Catenulispora sp. EB89 TaxID=3156257 RepID=UPI003517A891